MSKKIQKVESMAAIDIGSSELRLRIAQNSNGKMKFLESAAYPLNLGGDTFVDGKISFEKLDKACEIIKNFMNLINLYKVSGYRAVATTAIRESSNRDYILDQIKIKTGVDVEVIDDSEEKLYIYKLMSHLVSPELMESAMMLYTGSGNVGISIWENNRSSHTEIIRTGSLRISEMFEDMHEYSNQFYLIVEEYLKSFIHRIESDFPTGIKNMLTSGHEMSMIADLTGALKKGVFSYINVGKLHALFDEVKYKQVDKIAEDYDLPAEKAEVLLSALCLCKKLVELTRADTIITPLVTFSDALMFEMLYPQEFSKVSKEFDKSTIVTARALAKKYNDIEAHNSLVEKFALNIFDKIKKIHGMGKREKLLLQTAAILHDTGKFINIKSHSQYSYHIVKGSEIIGINSLEKEIIALICHFHSPLNPSTAHEEYSRLSMENRVLVSKLSAILKVADALDRSHEQKFSDIDVNLSDGEFIVTITTDKNIDLEMWAFSDKSNLFEEVFGIKAIIKKKRTM